MRDRERKVQQALRDGLARGTIRHRAALTLRTACAQWWAIFRCWASGLPVEQRAHFTGMALDKAHQLDTLIEEVLRYHAL